MRHFALAAALAGLTFAGSASAAVNLIANGSFEDNGTGHAAISSPWVYTGSTPNGAPATVIDYNSSASYPTGAFGEPIPPSPQVSGDPDPVGTHAAYFVADGATETLSQTIHLDAGTYTIGFSAYLPLNGFQNSGDATFTGVVAGDPLAAFDVHLSGAAVQHWQNFSGLVHVTTPGDFTTSFVYNSGPAPAADVVIDEVFVVAGDVTNGVPEPASWALMILGFGGVGAAVRGRRRTVATA